MALLTKRQGTSLRNLQTKVSARLPGAKVPVTQGEFNAMQAGLDAMRAKGMDIPEAALAAARRMGLRV